MRNSPQELVDYVIHFLRNDPTTLSATRLVSRAWNLSASVHLFRSLDLMISEEPKAKNSLSLGFHNLAKSKVNRGVEKFKALVSILQTSVDIPHCVREVTLGRTTQFRSTTTENYEKQDGYARLISTILLRLNRVSSVFFREMNWGTLSPAFFSCILKLCQSSTLEHIEVWNCQLLSASSMLHVLNAAETIRSLRLSYIRILDDIHAKLTEAQAPGTWDAPALWNPVPCKSSLYSLAIDANVAVHGVFGPPPSVVDFTKLRRLHLSNVNDGSSINEFLQRAGHELEFLDLRLFPVKSNPLQDSSGSTVIDLSYCPRLVHLRVSGLHWTLSFCPANDLKQLFSKIADQSYPLEFLHLMITIIKSKPIILAASPASSNPDAMDVVTSQRRNQLEYSDWNTFDVTLSSVFPSLRNIQIEIKSMRQHDVDVPTLLGSFATLRTRGVGIQIACT